MRGNTSETIHSPILFLQMGFLRGTVFLSGFISYKAPGVFGDSAKPDGHSVHLSIAKREGIIPAPRPFPATTTWIETRKRARTCGNLRSRMTHIRLESPLSMISAVGTPRCNT